MNINELKELRANAPAGPWMVMNDGLGNPAGVWRDHSGKGWINMSQASPYIVAMENIAPELIALVEAAQDVKTYFDKCMATYTPEGEETFLTNISAAALATAQEELSAATTALTTKMEAL